MLVPSATYRVQLNLNFRFADALALIPYLHDLGISHLYLSPRYKARKGSPHGYDVADPIRINSELGTEEEFDQLVERQRQYGMGLLLDIVPNHMAASPENPWWTDVLENGKESRYASYFDIEWEPQGPKISVSQHNRVLVPILADNYGRVLANQEITLRLDEKGFFIHYEGQRLPANPKTYPAILEICSQTLANSDAPGGKEILALSAAFANCRTDQPAHDTTANHMVNSAVIELKGELWRLYQSMPEIHKAIDETLRIFNGSKGNAESFDRLDSLLSMQAYRLAHWRVASEEINYRRFFDINHLVSLRMEDPHVFREKHAPILQLLANDKVSGLRVDHIDGLYDPSEYLQRVQNSRESTEGEESDALDIYIIIEKVLCGDETLPSEWPVAGTTGYDFLNAVNTLFIDKRGCNDLERTYRRFTGVDSSFSETWYVRKKQVMEELFGADIKMLAYRLGRLAARDRFGRDLPVRELTRGIKEITACLPVYRTYVRDPEISKRDKVFLERALAAMQDRIRPTALSETMFDFLRRVFLLESPFNSPDLRMDWLIFFMRWQQFSGAVMAKGFEDTAFFVYHPLLSLNEVGCNPFPEETRFGVHAFHQFNHNALKEHPHTLNATSTHDSKWSDDVRAKINVLSESSGEWKRRLRHWKRWNRPLKRKMNGHPVPSPNEEVLLYQSLLAIWPNSDVDVKDLQSRLGIFYQKAAREAKTHTSWISTNERYEELLQGFLSSVLDSKTGNRFLADLLCFRKKLAFVGACNAYSQVLLKMTSPGVPDFYQGSELWNFRLTDPDNRQPVDFQKRAQLLAELKAAEAEGSLNFEELLGSWEDGRLKLYLIWKVLNFRRSHHHLFLTGDYTALETAGKKRESVCSFARCFERTWVVTAVPRLVTKVVKVGLPPTGRAAWGSDTLILPRHAPEDWVNLFTGEKLRAWTSIGKKQLYLRELFWPLPFAVLIHTPPNHNGQPGTTSDEAPLAQPN